MNFDETHYVPVLKIKGGEKDALAQLSSTVRARIRPLLEVVERDDEEKTPTEHIDTTFKKFKPAVEHLRSYFLDCREVAPAGPEIAEDVFRRAEELGVRFVPVTGITRSVDQQAALAHRTNGLALRLTVDEFDKQLVRNELLPFVKTIGVPREVIDLIVDLGAVDDMVLPGAQNQAADFLNDIPDPTSWRTLTLSAAAFPIGMGDLQSRSHDLLDRIDWLTWRDGIRAANSFPRAPTYSDGVIQHPSGVENIDWRTRTPSASIRYATGDQWLRIKGESTRVNLPSDQFPALAENLVDGHLSTYFAGASHCEGCFGIRCAADGADGYGGLTKWRTIGTIHHITHVIEQLDALAAP